MNRSLTLPNDLAGLEKLNLFLEEAGEAWGWGPDLLFQLNLAVEEVVTNIMRHGYGPSMKDAKIFLEMAFDGERITICITDEGIAFDPLSVPPPDDLEKSLEERRIGGLGIWFVRQMMDEVAYRRENGQNILAVRKRVMNAES